MTLHVDILVNDWVKGVQRRAACLRVNGSDQGVTVEGPEAARWQDLVRPIMEPGTGQLLAPDTASKDWLEALVHRSDYTYVTLVGPHFDDECDFVTTDVVSMVASRRPEL